MKCTLLVLCLLPLAINAMYIRARYAGGLRGFVDPYDYDAPDVYRRNPYTGRYYDVSDGIGSYDAPDNRVIFLNGAGRGGYPIRTVGRSMLSRFPLKSQYFVPAGGDFY